MMIKIGTDIVNIERIEKLLNKYTNRLCDRILSSEELLVIENISHQNNKIRYLAKRFAAKESVSKALGVGIGEQFSFKDISILNDKNGKPIVIINPSITNSGLLQNASKIEISLSDDHPFAVAFAIIYHPS